MSSELIDNPWSLAQSGRYIVSFSGSQTKIATEAVATLRDDWGSLNEQDVFEQLIQRLENQVSV